MAEIYRHRFGPLVSDQGDFDAAVSTAVDNFVPYGSGFVPTHVLDQVVGVPTPGGAGLGTLANFDDEYYYYPRSNMYELRDNAGTWSTTARTSGLSLATDTSMVRFGDSMIATDNAEAVQIQTARGTSFTDCFTGPFKPKFKYAATLGERVVFANGKSFDPESVEVTDASFISGFRPWKGDSASGNKIGFLQVDNHADLAPASAATGDFAIEVHCHIETLPSSGKYMTLAGLGTLTNGSSATASTGKFAYALSIDSDGDILFEYLDSSNNIVTTRSSSGAGSFVVSAGDSYAISAIADCTSGPNAVITAIYVNGNRRVLVTGSAELNITSSVLADTSKMLFGTMFGSVTNSSGKFTIGEIRYWVDSGFGAGSSDELSTTDWVPFDAQVQEIPGESALQLHFKLDELSGSSVTNHGQYGSAAAILRRFEGTGYGLNEAWAAFVYSPTGGFNILDDTQPLSISGSDNNDNLSATLSDTITTNYLYLSQAPKIEKSGNTITLSPDIASPGTDPDPNIVWWTHTNNARLIGSEETHPAGRTGWQLLYDDHGDITGLSGGRQFALIFKEKAIYRMNAGGPFGFEFQQISSSIGTKHHHSIIRVGDNTYFWGPSGPAVANFNGAQSIGYGKITRLLNDDEFIRVDKSYSGGSVHAGYASSLNSIVWVYKTTLAVIYSIDRDEFTFCTLADEISSGLICKGIASRFDYRGQTSESWRPLGELVIAMDSTDLTDGFYTVDELTQSGTSDLSDDDASNPKISTGFIELQPGATAQVIAVRPVLSMSRSSDVDPDVEVTITSRQQPFDKDSDDNVVQVELSTDGADETGFIPCMNVPDYAYHRFDVRLYQGINAGKIVELVGLDIEYTQGGRR